MRAHYRFAALAVTVAGCIDPANPVPTEIETQAVTSCLPTFQASAPVPAPTTWAGKLPTLDQGVDQIWLFIPTSGQLTTYNLYQINRETKTVMWWSPISAQDRPTAMYLTGGRSGNQISIRYPPPPPWPAGDEVAHADYALNIGFHALDAARLLY
jgi:hypothetical protein